MFESFYSIFRDGDSMISLGNLSHCSGIFIVKKCFLVLRWKLLCFKSCLLIPVFSESTEKSLAPSSAPTLQIFTCTGNALLRLLHTVLSWHDWRGHDMTDMGEIPGQPLTLADAMSGQPPIHRGLRGRCGTGQLLFPTSLDGTGQRPGQRAGRRLLCSSQRVYSLIRDGKSKLRNLALTFKRGKNKGKVQSRKQRQIRE